MAPSRLLQSGTRRPRPEAAEDGTTTTELPPYEPPAQVLSEFAKRDFGSVASNNESQGYQHHLNKSIEYLRNAVGSINEHLVTQRANLARLQERSASKGKKSDLELQLEQDIPELEAAVAELTNKSEAALRQVLDYRAELEDENKVLESVLEQASKQQPRVVEVAKPKPERRSRGGEGSQAGIGIDDDENDDDEAEDEEMPDAQDETPLQGLPELLKLQREAAADEYAALTLHQRYAANNEYIAFKQTWHSALHPDEDVPLADPSTWFDEEGRPTWHTAPQADEDEELVVERVIVDLKCQLSLVLMTEPYSNRKCKHTFQKDAILEFLRQNRGRVKCPVCSTEIRNEDLYLDEAFQRRVKRHLEAERREREEAENDDEDDDVADSSVIPGMARNIKRERGQSRRVGDDEDMISESE
ncbi:zinc-finger of the MIZ type in Nse subunit-domain-containing protein [Podospora aff. communis PSN243]|uniref:Zinc-finger of the MIZ type in Nse subunit-domain-containing protein n=1 Tax=Podospora aff. communis PSN243 TaxID=3040156 RepID=A0AAV9GZW1_9PEZI|nr:zinc-finger of the MIZ type in Nse subunit-domain-containing protein [Podospora aff. communis PSN243]